MVGVEDIKKCLNDALFEEWYRIVERPTPRKLDWGHADEFPYLDACLQNPTLDLRTAQFEPGAFGPFGPGSVLCDDEFIWLLPHIILQFLNHDEGLESIYAGSIVHRLIELDRRGSPTWAAVRQQLSESTLDCLEAFAEFACEVCWSHLQRGEQRIEKHLQRCKAALGRT